MEAVRRLLVAIGGLILLAAGVFVAVLMINHVYAAAVLDYLDRCTLYTLQLIFFDGHALWAPIVALVLLIIAGALLLVAALWRKQQPRRMNVLTPEGVAVEISLEAINSVVRRAAGAVKEVRGLTSRLAVVNGGLRIMLDVVVPANEAIPAIGANVRQEVATQVEAMTGIVPQEISVRVSNVTDKPEGGK